VDVTFASLRPSRWKVRKYRSLQAHLGTSLGWQVKVSVKFVILDGVAIPDLDPFMHFSLRPHGDTHRYSAAKYSALRKIASAF
jgi:hypothetical protein